MSRLSAQAVKRKEAARRQFASRSESQRITCLWAESRQRTTKKLKPAREANDEAIPELVCRSGDQIRAAPIRLAESPESTHPRTRRCPHWSHGARGPVGAEEVDEVIPSMMGLESAAISNRIGPEVVALASR